MNRNQGISRAALGALGLWLMFSTTVESAGWEDAKGYRFMKVAPQASQAPGFTLMEPAQTGVTFTNLLGDARSAANRNLLSGSGCATGDVDGDGLCDVYFCGLESGNVLYRNLGNWKFQDVTAGSGIAFAAEDSTAAVFVDADGDGDLDLFVSGMGTGVRLFLNDGKGKFQESTTASGLASKRGSMSMAFADIDGDGDLDLYVANYRPSTVRDRPTTQFRVQRMEGRSVVVAVDGRPTTAPDLTNRFELSASGEVMEFSEPSDLFLNDGRGRFQRVPFTEGRFLDESGNRLAQTPLDWSLSVRFYDWTGDGAPDLYICNDLFSPDRAWVNDGRGHFRAAPKLALRHTSSFSMGADFADFNRDGFPDFCVVDMLSRDLRMRKIQIAGQSLNFNMPGEIENRPQVFQNTLQVNRGDGTFFDAACFAGLEASEWSWQPVAIDVDLDGFEDILVPNGMLRDFQNIDIGERVESAVASKQTSSTDLARMFGAFPGLFTPNLAFRNRGDLTFEEVGARWGFATPGISQGMALADLDNDGDLDVVVNNFKAVAGLYRNDGSAPRLGVRLKGKAPNTAGIGARLKVSGGPIEQTQEFVSGGRYLSGDEAMRTFAAGRADALLKVEVTWRSGTRTTLQGVPANSVVVIDEADAQPAPPSPAPAPPWFEDVSARLSHTHHEVPFDDFGRQSLLPKDLSQAGPGVCWTDVDGDGLEDLLVGTGSGGRVAAFRSDGKGGFTAITAAPFDTVMPRDTAGFLGGFVLQGHRVIVAGSSNYEDGQESGSMVRVLDPEARGVIDPLPGQRSSIGPVSAADVDGDGDLDLFVGGRVVPGSYPEPASSFLFVNDGTRLRLDPRSASTFINLGLVNGSVFTDLDDDGDADLVLALEWGPIRVFRNDQGAFSDVTEAWGLSPLVGWWQSVTAGDFDGDGRMDIVAGNWGLNSTARPTREHPALIYAGDFMGRGQMDLIEAVFDPITSKVVPERDLRILGLALPVLRDHFKSHQEFASATVQEVLGERFSQARKYEASTLSSMVFLNRGGKFEAHALPGAAQLSPVFGISVCDLNGDGLEDLFLGQNFFAVQPFATRQDAGEGLVLIGDGKGGFQPMLGPQSGIRVHGQQRGVAAGDFDRDGRVDLVVAQNGASTRLFRNLRAAPGVRIRLAGSAGNPSAIGALVRVGEEGKWGPAREIHAGSGYWSQDAATQVMSIKGPGRIVSVRWPGGRRTTSPIPTDATEVTVRSP